MMVMYVVSRVCAKGLVHLLVVPDGVQAEDLVLHASTFPGSVANHRAGIFDISAKIVASSWQHKVQLILQSKSHEDVLQGAAGTLVSLQECNFVFLQAVLVPRVVNIVTGL